MKNLMLLGVAFLLAIPAVFAQTVVGLTPKTPFRNSHYQITYGLGVQQIKIDEKTAQNENVNLTNGMARFEMNVDWFYKKLTFGASFSAAASGKKQSVSMPSQDVKTSMATWGARVSYNILRTETFKIQPFLGYRLGATNLRFSKNTDEQIVSPTDFQTLLIQKTSEVQFAKFSHVLELGVNLQYAIRLKPKTGEVCSPCNCSKSSYERERYIPIGLNFGYNLDLGQGNWKHDKKDVVGMPFAVDQSGFFMTLFVGFNHKTKYYKN